MSDHIWEIKTHHGKEQYRLLCFVEREAVIIAVVGVAKKTRALRQQDLELAEQRRKDHLRRRARKLKSGP